VLEDRTRTGKTTGFGPFPSRFFAVNAAWLELALTGIDLICWTQHLLLDGPLAVAEPKKLRYQLLHVAGRHSLPYHHRDTDPSSGNSRTISRA
jgi:hypothetical protein